MYQDKTLKCRDCGQDFTWTAGEQDFFAQKGFDKPPIRCHDCRKKKKSQHQTPQDKPTGELFEITCSSCGKKSEVDFKPRGQDEILCSNCFAAKHG
ncbi:zinc-binding protein [Candidatus Berkelbacteria bacterium RIFCSPHIGHO2_12_FULL_36_9]|uniref:Zinc-binding protein n=1 Tax=Candidatus Berkelbacteria bacterium RIFCSPHIGHO2_12_FULL_36_9 TaxID=1797469 RepID=A0A1F5EKC4_9BACT|nr:MAG: zinc-binding protein [Candidatus Berkelbacteria bacterium RIFCSPHIGHO2_12_FULL_36_9]